MKPSPTLANKPPLKAKVKATAHNVAMKAKITKLKVQRIHDRKGKVCLHGVAPLDD
jgi:hypothetical protein